MPQASLTSPPFRLQTAILWVFWFLLTAAAVWRVQLALDILLRSDLPQVQGSAVVHWRRLDELLPWVALALFALGSDVAARSLRQVREGRLIALAIAIGAILTGIGVALDQPGVSGTAAGGFSFAGALALALVALLLAVREVRNIYLALRTDATARGKGVTIIDLWRFAAAQWGLLMAAAIFGIIAAMGEGRLGNRMLSALFFFLPAAAMIPNTLMFAGIALWNDMLVAAGSTPPRPRVRAWLVAFAALQVGPVLFLAGLLPRLHAGGLVFPGAAFELLGIIFYLAAFPTSAWRGIGGKAHLAAWICLAIALIAATLELAAGFNDQMVSIYYSAAWRHLWSTGAITLWAIAMGVNALKLLASPTRAARLGTLVTALLVLGLLGTVTVQLLTAERTGEAQVPVMRWLFTGAGLELVAMLVLAGGIVRLKRQK